MQIAAAWLLGTLCVHELPRLPEAVWCAPAALAALLALRSARTRWVVFALLGFGWTALTAGGRLDGRLPIAQLGQDFPLAGFVDGFPVAAPGQATFSFTVTEPRPAGVPSRVRLTWYDPPPALTAGAELAIVARLRPPRGLRNPGGFDYERWLLVNGFGASGYVRSGEVVEDGVGPRGRTAASQASSSQPRGRNRETLGRTWLAFRATLAERIAAGSPDADSAALLTALAIGERHLFSDEHWADFRRTGTSHLVAVSGTHVGLFGAVVFFVLRWLWIRLPQVVGRYDLEAAALASAAATAYYAALTGFAVPAQRSLLMIVVALALLASRRRVGVSQGLSAALLAVLVVDPFAPLAASFWLSFVAVAIVLLLAAPRRVRREGEYRVRRIARALRDAVALQWSIGLALLPLTAWYFGEISTAGSLVNLAAIPWFNFVLVPLTLLATLACSFDALASTVAPPLLHAAGVLAGYTVTALHAVAAQPWAAVTVPARAGALALAAAGALLALPAHALPGRRLAWLALVPMFLDRPAPLPPGAAEVTVLDVGHGLAVVAATHAHRLLFDAGPTFPSGFDSGEQVVLPALAALGGRGLDALIVSHADNDHAGGAAAVAAAYPSARVLHGPDVTALGGEICARGQEWEWDGVRFEILHPPPEGFAARGNESSCVLKVTAAGGSVLITGDIEARGEAALAPLAAARADVIVVPHHGSATSSSAALVRAVGARYAIVSAGYANRWGFPKPAVRERWQASGAAVLVTGDAGALRISLGTSPGASLGLASGDGGVAVQAERDGRHRYWEARAASAESSASPAGISW
ncbi:MAG TPA: DNA internalization-related competence protein ComEC/Rec2 [Gammaproteobacteria bacterium]|nr:DNA internalization-related competence protein ComEC/Rec2 [Gammaproteobacteria bacterium]